MKDASVSSEDGALSFGVGSVNPEVKLNITLPKVKCPASVMGGHQDGCI